MSNRMPAFLVAAAIVLYLIFSGLFVVNEREQAIVLRFGEIQRVESDPGLYFKMPFAFAGLDTVQIGSRRFTPLWHSHDFEEEIKRWGTFAP